MVSYNGMRVKATKLNGTEYIEAMGSTSFIYLGHCSVNGTPFTLFSKSGAYYYGG